MEDTNSVNSVQNVKLVDLLKELITTQAQISKVEAATFTRTTKGYISEKVADLKQYVDDQAKIYKQSKTDVTSVIQYYEGVLKQVKAEYRKEKKSLIQEKGEWEKAEAETIAEYEDKKQELKEMPGYKEFAKRKAEIRQLRYQGKTKESDKKQEEFNEYKQNLQKRRKVLETKMNLSIQQGDIELVKKQTQALERLIAESNLAERDTELGKIRSKIKLCRKSIDEQNKKIESCEKNFEDAVEEITNSQEHALSKVDKQNIFQKLLVRVFGSAKQFDKNVMSPLKQKMQKFKDETLPEKVVKMELESKKRKENLKEKTGKAVETVGKTFTSIIDGARKGKDTIVNGLKGKMLDRINKNKQKSAEHNLNNPDRFIGDTEVTAQYGKYKDGILNDTSHDEM